MRHIVLPTYEFHPVNPGGAGVFVSGATLALAKAGYRVTVLCDFPRSEVAEVNALLSRRLGSGASAIAVHVGDFVRPAVAEAVSVFEQKSRLLADALVRLDSRDPIDLIEFPEYAGLGLESLRRRAGCGVFANTRMVVRAHGSLELIDRAEGTGEADIDRRRMYEMERSAMRLADVVFAPSQAIGALYGEIYGLDLGFVRVSPPPMDVVLDGLVPVRRTPVLGHFLFYGKLQEVKGCDLFVQAAASVANERRSLDWRFTLVGRDTPCPRHSRMTSRCLASLIPKPVIGCFDFMGPIKRGALAGVARNAMAAVVPSRFETFCLAAHELRALGLPLVVPRIPAFVDYFSEETGCVTYDGTANGLRNVLLGFCENPGLAADLAVRPGPQYPYFADAYEEVFADESPSSTSLLRRAIALRSMTRGEGTTQSSFC